jgi:DNA polymerase III epsilon subunit-like protein
MTRKLSPYKTYVPSKRQLAALRYGQERMTCQGCWREFPPTKLAPHPFLDTLQKYGFFTSATHDMLCPRCFRIANRKWNYISWLRKQQQETIQWAQLMMTLNAYILDTETTGLDRSAQICEITVLNPGGTPAINTLLNPGIPIPIEASNVHGITDVMVQDAPSFKEIRVQLEALLRGQTCIIYNVGYDTKLLQRSGFDLRFCAWECAMEAYARFYGQWSSYHGSFTWQNLVKAIEQCGLEFPEPAHRSLGDCQATRMIVEYMAQQNR